MKLAQPWRVTTMAPPAFPMRAALHEPIDKPGGKSVSGPEDVINLDREAGNVERRFAFLEDRGSLFAALYDDSRWTPAVHDLHRP